MAINNPHHLLMAWDASRVSHVSWELFLDNPTFFFVCFTKYYIKNEGTSQTIGEGGKEEGRK